MENLSRKCKTNICRLWISSNAAFNEPHTQIPLNRNTSYKIDQYSKCGGIPDNIEEHRKTINIRRQINYVIKQENKHGMYDIRISGQKRQML